MQSPLLPVPKLAVYGFQHVLAFYAGAVIVPILLANAINLTTEQLIHLTLLARNAGITNGHLATLPPPLAPAPAPGRKP